MILNEDRTTEEERQKIMEGLKKVVFKTVFQINLALIAFVAPIWTIFPVPVQEIPALKNQPFHVHPPPPIDSNHCWFSHPSSPIHLKHSVSLPLVIIFSPILPKSIPFQM